MPSDFSRRARDINYSDYKQSEWRNLLLFFVTKVAAPLPIRLQRLWLRLSFLVKACYLPEQEYLKITTNLDDLQALWYDSFSTTMGDQNCTYVVHQVGAHLHNIVRKKGPLHLTNAYPFEYAYSKMRRRYKGTNNTVKQILSNSLLEHATSTHENHKCTRGVHYSAWRTSKAHDCIVYSFEDKFQIYRIEGPHPIHKDSFVAKKFVMRNFVHAATKLPFHQVGMFQKTLPTALTHRLLKSKICGKVIILDNVMITVPSNILAET